MPGTELLGVKGNPNAHEKEDPMGKMEDKAVQGDAQFAEIAKESRPAHAHQQDWQQGRQAEHPERPIGMKRVQPVKEDVLAVGQSEEGSLLQRKIGSQRFPKANVHDTRKGADQ